MAALVLCGSTLWAQAPEPLKPQQPLEPGWEAWVAERPVAGGLRVGIMYGGNAPVPDPTRFAVLLPATELPLLCVEVSSLDGAYEAQLRYDIRRASAGLLWLELPTGFAERLGRLRSHELAMLASVGERCDRAPALYALATWAGTSRSDSITVFVNSRLPTSIVASREGRVRERARCTSLRQGGEGPVVGYNQKCVIPDDWITLGLDLHVLESAPNNPQPIALPIRLPD